MSGKPELSAAPGVQNVVVYVSNDNFAQAYAVNHSHVAQQPPPQSQAQQQPPPASNHHHQQVQSFAQVQAQHHHHQQQQQQQQQQPPNNVHMGYGHAPLPPKIYEQKLQLQQQQFHAQLQQQQLQQQQQQQQQLECHQFNHQPPVGDYFTNQTVIAHQNGYAHAAYAAGKDTVDDLHQQQLRAIKDDFAAEGTPPAVGYVVLGGAGGGGGDAGVQRSCDSVRSEAAESSCSSLSSAEEALGLPHGLAETANVLVYEGGADGASAVNVRHGVVVAVGGPGTAAAGAVAVSGAPIIAAAQPPQLAPSIPVPHGWKRVVTNADVIYISPSNTALGTLDQVKDYLLTPETCKCGLECPLKCDHVFNFDPKVVGKAWTFNPDASNSDLTKLCNHKRKHVHHLKDCNQMVVKKKKRKLSAVPAPYAAGVSVAQILAAAQPEKINPKVGHSQQPLQIFQQQPPPPQSQQFITKDNLYQQPPPPNQSAPQQAQQQRYLTSQGLISSEQQIFYQNAQQQQQPTETTQPPEVRLSSPLVADQMILTPSQHISQPQQHQSQPGLRHIMGANGEVLSLVTAGAAGQQRMFINGQPTEPSGPGRPVMIPVSIATSPAPPKNEKVQGYIQHGQVYHGVLPQAVRHIVPNGIRPHIQVQQQIQQHLQPQKAWSRVPIHTNPSVYERVPPLHQHQPHAQPQHQSQHQHQPQPPSHGQLTPVQIQVWPDEVHRKKMKTKAKKRYVEQGMNMQTNSRMVQITSESSPSFLEDPSGYLAQQTALLNSTINQQTGANSFICNSPQSSSQIGTPPISGVPLPSNMKPYRPPQAASVKTVYQSHHPHPNTNPNSNSNPNPNPDSASTNAIPKCVNCDHQPALNGREQVTSSNYNERPDSRPIQGGTVSTSNVSPVAVEGDDGSPSQDLFYVQSPPQQQQQQQQQQQHTQVQVQFSTALQNGRGIVTTMASGRTVGSNTITSVLAGRANTATVSISNPPSAPPQSQAQSAHSARSPLEMVQNIVSSIKLPHSQNSTISLQGLPSQVVQKGLPPGHILVSSGGQLIMATTNAQHQQPQQQMPPPPPKIQTSMPPISVSPMITNVTASVTQMIPAVAQQVLGQQTVLVNALPGSFVLQPGVTMTMDGMNQLQLQPQLVAGNVIQQQLQPSLLSPEKNKKSKKRKVTPPTMVQIATPQNSGVVGFPQQIQMHSPPVMQALTIVPNKNGGGPHFVMNGQMSNAAQIINSQSQPINLLQPVNLAQGVVQNFPTIQQFVLPTNLAGMVMNADGTATIVQDANIGMQLQLQNVNGQNVLTPVQTNNQMFTVGSTNGQGLLPGGMVLRPQGKIIQQQHSPGAQFLSPTGGSQFVTQFNGQLSPLVASVSPGQQVTFSPQIRPTVQQSVQQPEFLTCGQTLMVPANLTAVSQSSTNQQNTTYVQQNTTIVQQQTTMVSNQNNTSQAQAHTHARATSHQHQHQQVAAQQQSVQNLQQNVESFVISSDKQNIQAVLVQRRQSPMQQQHQQQQHQQINYGNSASPQIVNGHAHAQSVRTLCQTSSNSAGSPPDTTTLSPLALGGQSPPTADTTTHSGSTDDGLSPAPSNCSSTMAMVHCISSSEPDSAEMANQDLDATIWRNTSKMDFAEINALNTQLRKTTPTRVAFAESSTMMHFVSDGMLKGAENVVSSRSFEKQKRKHSDTLIVMETHSLFDENDQDDVQVPLQKKVFVVGDLVWGPAKGCPAWPGKLMVAKGPGAVTVRWFGGGDKALTDVDPSVLQTLSEGLDAHHRASKKSRTGRKLNAQLDKAIQEAMAELDRISNDDKLMSAKVSASEEPHDDDKKKSSKPGRLRSSRQT